jgi:serine/threonine protein kinase
VIRGVREMHALGYVHTNLNLENILINIDPPDVKISDFENAKLSTNISRVNFNDSRLFKPITGEFRYGDERLDYYAVASLIIFMFITKDIYTDYIYQSELINDAKIYMNDKHANKVIKDLIKTFLINEDVALWYDIKALEEKFMKLDWTLQYRNLQA